MYREIPEALRAGATDPDVVVTVLTGTGSYYSSGNDMNAYTKWQGSDLEKVAQEAAMNLQ